MQALRCCPSTLSIFHSDLMLGLAVRHADWSFWGAVVKPTCGGFLEGWVGMCYMLTCGYHIKDMTLQIYYSGTIGLVFFDQCSVWICVICA